ncbi:hypothetical protein [Lactococcus sp. DD01]|uniref:hypothetical protein n=1 Tax=Lactococcus sp. DD01 TaxID=1776443 RepID=UPI0007760EDF|nr:hypothetical protein [Lactococcus sp. DD01]KXT62801.1 hypothetical protein LACDD01_00376 [Lactococcus sp. DD01]
MEQEHFYIQICGNDKKLKIIDALKQELLKAFETKEMIRDDLFLFPTVNFAMSLIDDIENCYFGNRFIPCAILTRSLLDATMSLIYFLQVPSSDYDSFFENYFKTGELTKSPDKKGKRWRVTGKELCETYKNKVAYDVNEAYKNLSKYVHPTIRHFYSIYQDSENGAFGLTIYGSKTEFSEEQYLELHQLIYSCIDVFVLVLKQRGETFQQNENTTS